MSAICDTPKKKVGDDQLYNPGEDRKSGSWRSDQLEGRHWNEEYVPEKRGSQVPGWATQENGKETLLWL